MSAKEGYLYVMQNGSIANGTLLKIGVTTKHPLERVKELSSSSGVATPFVLAFYKKVNDPFVAEAAIHRQLEYCRTNDSREFFLIPLEVAIRIVSAYEYRPVYYLPFSELFNTFPDDGTPRELDEEEQQLCRDLEWELRYSRPDGV